jgi:LPS-assembly lipoprotein
MLIMLSGIKPMQPSLRSEQCAAASWVRCLLLTGLVLSLAACGFHLEGALPAEQPIAVTHVESVEPHSEFFLALTDALSSRGVRLDQGNVATPVTLKILEDVTGQRVLSVSARNIPREYEVFYSVRFSLENGESRLLEPQSIVVTRSYTYDETQVLGKNTEEDVVRRTLAADLARQVVRRLAAIPASTPTPTS